MKRENIFSFLGLAMKSGSIKSGEFSTEKAVKSGNASLVIVAEDASENTKKMFRNMCVFYQVPLHVFGSKAELGHAIGKETRASLAVTDAGFANSINSKLEETKMP